MDTAAIHCAMCKDTTGPFHHLRGIYGEGWICDDIFGCKKRDESPYGWFGGDNDGTPEPGTGDFAGSAVVGAGVHSGQAAGRGRLTKGQALSTPLAFRDVLLGMAHLAAKAAA